jgi:hypothetical protein
MNEYEIMIKNLENRVTELEKQLFAGAVKFDEPVKWQPKGGDWWIGIEGNVFEAETSKNAREFGHERPTKQQAERAAVEMRKFNRLLALRDELCGDDAELGIYHIIFQNRDGTYFIGYSEQQNNEIGSVRFTTREHAKRACDMLNSGEVEL